MYTRSTHVRAHTQTHTHTTHTHTHTRARAHERAYTHTQSDGDGRTIGKDVKGLWEGLLKIKTTVGRCSLHLTVLNVIFTVRNFRLLFSTNAQCTDNFLSYTYTRRGSGSLKTSERWDESRPVWTFTCLVRLSNASLSKPTHAGIAREDLSAFRFVIIP